MSENPWIDRFSIADDDDALQRAMSKMSSPLSGLERLPPECAVAKIQSNYETLFIPTPSNKLIIRQILKHFRAGSSIRYPDRVEVRNRCYDNANQQILINPLCVTGLAGVGKSALLATVAQMIGDSSPTALDESLTAVPVRGVYLRKAQGPRTAEATSHAFAEWLGINPSKNLRSDEKFKVMTRIAYRNGVAGIALDESQHLSWSSSANANVTSTLMKARETGVPMSFTCNFSLLHRLIKRPQEDRDRILANILVVPRDLADSESWELVVAGILGAIDQYCAAELKKAKNELGRMSGLLPRNLIRLVAISYKIMRADNRTQIALQDVRSGFNSPEYYSAREDIHEIARIDAGGSYRTKRKDLYCPVDLLHSRVEEADTKKKASYNNLVATALLKDSMTLAETKDYQAVSLLAVDEKNKKPPTKLKSRSKPTIAELLAGHNRVSV